MRNKWEKVKAKVKLVLMVDDDDDQAPFHLQIMVAISIYAISPLNPRYFCQYRLKAQDYTSAIRILPKAMAKCRSPHWKRRSELHFACR